MLIAENLWNVKKQKMKIIVLSENDHCIRSMISALWKIGVLCVGETSEKKEKQ